MSKSSVSGIVPAADGDGDRASGMRICSNRKWIVLWSMLVLAVVLDSVCEWRWLRYFYDVSSEWFQTPLPNYGTMMEYRHVLRLVCGLVVVLLAVYWGKGSVCQVVVYWGKRSVCLGLGRNWNNRQTISLLFLLYQMAVLGMEAVYDGRWVYTFGWNAEICLDLLIGIPLLLAWILSLSKCIFPWMLPMFILADWLLYLGINIHDLSSESVWLNSYVDIVERAVFALVMILAVVAAGMADRREIGGNGV